MALNASEKTLIRDSWKQIKERAGGNKEVGTAIFLRLFDLAPEFQQLFPFKDEPKESLPTSTKLARHGSNFVRNVEKAVEGLDSLYGDVGPKLVALGARHYGYGAKEENYDVAGQAMIDVMAKVLDSDFTPEVRDAWLHFYKFIQDAMVEGGRDH